MPILGGAVEETRGTLIRTGSRDVLVATEPFERMVWFFANDGTGWQEEPFSPIPGFHADLAAGVAARCRFS